MSNSKRLTTSAGAPIADNQNSITAGPRGPLLMQDYRLLEKLAHQNRERVYERGVHAKGWGAHGTFIVTYDINQYNRAKIFSEVGKETPLFARFSTVTGELGAADAEHDVRGFALKFYTEEVIRSSSHQASRDVLKYLNNLLKQPIVVAKRNRFPSLYSIADTGDGHIKFAGKIDQRHFQLTRRPVA